jgi:hypothetical protein
MKYCMLLVAAAAFTLSSPSIADACKCKHTSYAKALAAADAVFTGKLVKIDLAARKRGEVDEFTFEVTRVYKGKVSRSVIVVSTVSSCGLKTGGLKVGKRYLVYAESDDGRLSSRQCRRTRLLSSKAAQSDLAKLGSGTAP